MPIDQQRLHRVLNPKSVVVVGDKGPNLQWLTNQKEFPGPLYSVQVDPTEIKGIEERGFKNYTSLADVPGDIDLLICAVPRQIAPRIVADAVARGVGGIAMYTAGFAETREELGIELQQRIVGMATATDRTGEIQLTNGLRELLKSRPIYACEVKGVRHDTGNKLGFLKALVYFALQRPDLAEPFRRYLETLDVSVRADVG